MSYYTNEGLDRTIQRLDVLIDKLNRCVWEEDGLDGSAIYEIGYHLSVYRDDLKAERKEKEV